MRCFAFFSADFAFSLDRVRSRMASSSARGTNTGDSSPARCRRASLAAWVAMIDKAAANHGTAHERLADQVLDHPLGHCNNTRPNLPLRRKIFCPPKVKVLTPSYEYFFGTHLFIPLKTIKIASNLITYPNESNWGGVIEMA